MITHRLTGKYVGIHRRQDMARELGCAFVLDLHFNAFEDPSAHGGKCYYKTGSEESMRAAQRLVQAFAACGLPLRGEPCSEARETRAAFIDHYSCPTVLLEPLFITNPQQAAWLHANTNKLAGELAAALGEMYPQATVGLSVGHTVGGAEVGGADCALGDAESQHGIELARCIESALRDQQVGERPAENSQPDPHDGV